MLKLLILLLIPTIVWGGELLQGYKYNPYQQTYQYGTEHRFNPMTRKMDTVSAGQVLQFDYYNRKWQYSSPDSELRYNPMSREYEQASPTALLRQNPMTREWTYEAK